MIFYKIFKKRNIEDIFLDIILMILMKLFLKKNSTISAFGLSNIFIKT